MIVCSNDNSSYEESAVQSCDVHRGLQAQYETIQEISHYARSLTIYWLRSLTLLLHTNRPSSCCTINAPVLSNCAQNLPCFVPLDLFGLRQTHRFPLIASSCPLSRIRNSSLLSLCLCVKRLLKLCTSDANAWVAPNLLNQGTKKHRVSTLIVPFVNSDSGACN